jgi:hypothetical protein
MEVMGHCVALSEWEGRGKTHAGSCNSAVVCVRAECGCVTRTAVLHELHSSLTCNDWSVIQGAHVPQSSEASRLTLSAGRGDLFMVQQSVHDQSRSRFTLARVDYVVNQFH